MFDIENLSNPVETIRSSFKIITVLFLVGVTGRFMQDAILKLFGL
ncbi:MAG: hypothetical protein H6Q58_284 [Firmicutes bacterium]|nr:hypothetical protein [Bacillota bacterium]